MANTTTAPAAPVVPAAVAAPAVPAVPAVNPVTGTTMSPDDRETQLRLQILEAELEETQASAEVAKAESLRRKAEVAKVVTSVATMVSLAGYFLYGAERADTRAQAKKASFWKK